MEQTVIMNEDGSYDAFLNKSITLKGKVNMEQTLNSRVLKIIYNNSDYVTSEHSAIDDFKYEDLAKSIERLVLQNAVDLLDDVLKHDVSDMPVYGGGMDVIYPENIKQRKNELQKQLNELV